MFPLDLDNHDSRLKYYHLLMQLPADTQIPSCPLPDGFSFCDYADGDRDTWIEIEKSAKEFSTYAEGLDAWQHYYAGNESALSTRMLFIVAPNGEKVATATAYFDPQNPATDGFLHWVSVRRDMQGRGLARPLIAQALHRLRELGYRNIYVSTQTTTWVAARLYLDFGFLPTPENAVASAFGWQMLKTLTNHRALDAFAPLPFDALLAPV